MDRPPWLLTTVKPVSTALIMPFHIQDPLRWGRIWEQGAQMTGAHRQMHSGKKCEVQELENSGS